MITRARRFLAGSVWCGSAGLLFLLVLLSGYTTSVRSAETSPALYPKSPTEMKAVLASIASKRDTGDSMKDIYLQRLKTYRYVCGVPYEDIAWSDEYAKLAHHASLINAKLNKLTHNPEKPSGMSDQEYALGKRGAGESNLFMGRTQPKACVDGWMDDSDSRNIDRVGHRRWCLNPAMLKSAFGTVGKYAAMYAFDRSRKPVPDWDFVAFPARGYMPIDLFGGHYAWSVSPNMRKYAKPSKNAVKATIQPVNEKLADAGGPLKLNYFNVENNGFGSGTAIIFRPESVAVKPGTRYKVTIAGLKTKSGAPAEIQYLVHFIDMDKIPYNTASVTSGTSQRPTAHGALNKPAQPAAKAVVIAPKALDEWQVRLVKKVDHLAKNGAKLSLHMGQDGDYSVLGAEPEALIVSVQGNRLPMPWTQISASYRAALARNAVRDDDVEALLIAGVMHLACGQENMAEDFFAKAALKDADAVKIAKAALSKP